MYLPTALLFFLTHNISYEKGDALLLKVQCHSAALFCMPSSIAFVALYKSGDLLDLLRWLNYKFQQLSTLTMLAGCYESQIIRDLQK